MGKKINLDGMTVDEILNLGHSYETGEDGKEIDYDLAFECYKYAADAGTVSSEKEDDKIVVTVIATGMPENNTKTIKNKGIEPKVFPNPITTFNHISEKAPNPFEIIPPVIKQYEPKEIVVPSFLTRHSLERRLE